MAATWAALQAEVADWLNREDLTTQILTFISNAEARFNRVLRAPEMEAVVQAAVSERALELPTDAIQIISACIEGDTRAELQQLSVAQLGREFPQDMQTGTPRFFALQAGSEILFGPVPDQEYTVVLNYYEKLPALGSSQNTNWLLTDHSDIYLAASAVEGFRFLRDTEGMAINDGVVRERLTELMNQGRRKQMSQARARLRTAFPLNSSSFDINRGF